MARREYTRIFKDPEVRAEMLNLRLQGYSFSALARKYECDHTSVIHQCQGAGIALSTTVRNQLFALIKQGLTQEEVSERLNVSGTVVQFYCYRYGVNGHKAFSNISLHLEPIAPPPSKVHPTATLVTQPKAILIRMDERGVEWSSDGHGGWVCQGMTEKQYKHVAMEKKRRDLEEKRLDMLTY